MNIRTWVFAGLILVAALAVAETTSPEEKGAKLLSPFKASLFMALTEGLRQGPARTIEICSEMAPELARILSTDGVTMGRSSHKLRNPDNAPPEWVNFDQEPVLVELGNGRYGYAEPIFIQPPCLACHGKEIAPAVAERLAEMYPEDEATGFEIGDFRGVFWVEFPAD